jgi:hypothetical protein
MRESNRMRWVWHVAEDESIKMLVVRPRHIWEDSIKTDLKEMAWERVDCSGQGSVLGLL